MKDFFVMTKRERRGTIVVLLLIAMVLLSTAAVRSCKVEAAGRLTDTALVDFEKDIDSARFHLTEPSSARKQHVSRPRSNKKKKSPRPSKSAPEPRRMDPVPQF